MEPEISRACSASLDTGQDESLVMASAIMIARQKTFFSR